MGVRPAAGSHTGTSTRLVTCCSRVRAPRRGSKHTNFELAVQVPLLIRAPWLPQSAGRHTSSFFELVDLYRTVAAAAGLPTGAIAADVDGTDGSALLESASEAAVDGTFEYMVLLVRE